MKAANIIKKALAQRRTALSEMNPSSSWLPMVVPVVQEAVAHDALQAVELTRSLGYPRFLKA